MNDVTLKVLASLRPDRLLTALLSVSHSSVLAAASQDLALTFRQAGKEEKFEFYREQYERRAKGGRVRAATAHRAPNGTFL